LQAVAWQGLLRGKGLLGKGLLGKSVISPYHSVQQKVFPLNGKSKE
jgi:hypothetical protein